MMNNQTACTAQDALGCRLSLPPVLALAIFLWPTSAAADQQPDQLIRQLSHGSLAARDAASSGLLALGPKALPAIEQAIPSATGEAAFRLPLLADAIALAETARRLEQPAAAEPGTAAGPLTVAVQQVDRLGTNGQRLLLRVSWQPQLAPVLLRLPLASVVAEGPAGEAVPPLSRRGVVEPLLTATRRWVELPIRLGPPPAGLAVLESLRGTIDCWLPGFAHRFTLPLPDLAAGQPDAAASPAPITSLGGVTVRCEAWSSGPAAAAGRQARVRLSAKFAKASEALASHRDWLADRHPELLLPTGEVVNAASHRVVSRSRQGLVVEAIFPLPDAGLLPGSRLAWRLPLGVTRVPFDFWLKSIPLAGPESGEK